MAWSVGEKVASMLLQAGVSILVLRHLTPSDLGAWGILTAIAAVALIVVDSGFSQALIRRENPAPGEYKAAFLFNVRISVALYLALTLLSPAIARFYAMPSVAVVAPVFFLLLPINALCVIQNTMLTRQMRFASMSKIVFASSVVSGVVAVALAVSGCGRWSFVGQRVAAMAVRTGLMWRCSDWRPTAPRKRGALRRMAPYSLSLMATDLIATLYNKIPQFFLGKLYPSSVLGYFDQAQKLKDLPVASTMQSVQSVTFPALAQIGGQPAKLAESYRQVAMTVAYVMFPVVAGLVAVAGDFFELFLGPEWMPTVPYFRVLCLTGLFYPVATVAYNVLKVRSDGRIVVRLEIVKKAVMTVVFAVTIPRSVTAVVWGLVAIACGELAINFAATTRFTALTFGRFLRTLLPVALTTALMYLAVAAVGSRIGEADAWLRLVLKIVAGVTVYWGLSAAFRLEAYREMVALVRRQTAKRPCGGA